MGFALPGAFFPWLFLLRSPYGTDGFVAGGFTHRGPEQLQGAAAVYHGVMNADHDGHVIALDAVNDVAVPQGQVAVEQWCVQERDSVIKLLHGAGGGHRQVSHMIIEIGLYGFPGGHILAQPLYFLVEGCGHLGAAKSLENLVHPGVFLAGRHLEHLVGGHVNLAAAVFQQQEGHVQCCQSTHEASFSCSVCCGVSDTSVSSSRLK